MGLQVVRSVLLCGWLCGLLLSLVPSPLMALPGKSRCSAQFTEPSHHATVENWTPPLSNPEQLAEFYARSPDPISRVRVALDFLANQVHWSGQQKALQWEIFANFIAAHASQSWRMARDTEHLGGEFVYKGEKGWKLLITPEGMIYKGQSAEKLDPSRPIWLQLRRWRGAEEDGYVDPALAANLDLLLAPSAFVADREIHALWTRLPAPQKSLPARNITPPRVILDRMEGRDRATFMKNWTHAQELIRALIGNRTPPQPSLIEDLNEVLSYAMRPEAESWMKPAGPTRAFLPEGAVLTNRERRAALERILQRVQIAEAQGEHPVRLSVMILQGIVFLDQFQQANLCTALSAANWMLQRHGLPAFEPKTIGEMNFGFNPTREESHPQQIIKMVTRNLLNRRP